MCLEFVTFDWSNYRPWAGIRRRAKLNFLNELETAEHSADYRRVLMTPLCGMLLGWEYVRQGFSEATADRAARTTARILRSRTECD